MSQNSPQSPTPAFPLHKKHPRLPVLVVLLVSASIVHGVDRAQGFQSSSETIAPVASQSSVYSQAKVELFTTSWCGYCRKAREFFQARGVAVIEHDIEKDPTAARRKLQLDTRPGVPLALINGHVVHGFMPKAYEKALRQGSIPQLEPKRSDGHQAPDESWRAVRWSNVA